MELVSRVVEQVKRVHYVVRMEGKEYRVVNYYDENDMIVDTITSDIMGNEVSDEIHIQLMYVADNFS